MSATAGIALSAIADKAKNAAIAFDSARAKASTLTDDSVGLGKSLRDLSAELKYQRNALKKRVYEVENDTQANKTNSQSLKDLILDVESLSKAYEDDGKAIGLATEKRKAIINEQLAAGTISQEKANTEALKAEKQGLEDRKQLITTEIPKLEAAKIGAKPEDIEKVNNKIKDLEGESANVRYPDSSIYAKLFLLFSRSNQSELRSSPRTSHVHLA